MPPGFTKADGKNALAIHFADLGNFHAHHMAKVSDVSDVIGSKAGEMVSLAAMVPAILLRVIRVLLPRNPFQVICSVVVLVTVLVVDKSKPLWLGIVGEGLSNHAMNGAMVTLVLPPYVYHSIPSGFIHRYRQPSPLTRGTAALALDRPFITDSVIGESWDDGVSHINPHINFTSKDKSGA